MLEKVKSGDMCGISDKIYDIRVLQKCESWYNSYRRRTLCLLRFFVFMTVPDMCRAQMMI